MRRHVRRTIVCCRVSWRGAPSALRLGLILTIGWLLLAFVYVYLNSSVVSLLKPNELGDFAAGVSAPLAFLWLVVAVFLQKEELQHNTRALLLQAAELKHAVRQYTDQTELWRQERQSESFKDEERRIGALVTDLLRDIAQSSDAIAVTFGERERLSTQKIFGNSKEVQAFLDGGREDRGFRVVQRRLANFLRGYPKLDNLSCTPGVLDALGRISSMLEAILSSSDVLQSDVLTSRIELYGLRKLSLMISEVRPELQGKAR
jgi:hypothetical protein